MTYFKLNFWVSLLPLSTTRALREQKIRKKQCLLEQHLYLEHFS